LVTGNCEAHTAFIRDEAAMGQWSSALNRALDER
jgi:hypothetical protein